MATIVCQALQSRLESQHPQVESTTLRLKLSTPKPLADQGGAWSFLQALSLPPPNAGERKDVYVHPQVKKWSLSDKSLEMCTEMLCSESGCDDMVSSLSSAIDSQVEKRRKSRQRQIKICHDFPPTLTTIRGGEALLTRARRRDGRLVMEAVKVTSNLTCFRSVRSHGSLRLYLSENSKLQHLSSDCVRTQCECDIIGANQQQQQCDNDVCLLRSREDVDGNNCKVGGEMGNGEFLRPITSSCKQGEVENKGLLNWEPFWVATS